MIRKAELRDAQVITDLWNWCIRETTITFTSTPKPLAQISEWIETRHTNGHHFLVHEADGAVDGFVTSFPFRGGDGYARVIEHSVLLAKPAWGKGVGRALMEALCTRAKADGIHSIMAGVSGDNPAGMNFHASCGFEEVARLREVGHKFDRWFDLVLMQKFL
ncbi:GNAT family N-acetyltransferase [Nereida sp. MMG025]|uniref:GNAT family N-acetyltransferase n=1 Tax=Nereida sp. MMG025 TaxID=2909981 RepID=UPI001F2E6B09|nr:GNAT family N-acetyltransferase [Nereida sp. MMG025]MCF6443910.1 N-acetyltransferase family protein [Nereida sp. MMG025]